GPRGKEMVTPAAKRKAVAHLRDAFGMSERRACSRHLRSNARGFRCLMDRAIAHNSRKCLRRMAPRSRLARRNEGQARAWREARQRDQEHVDALRLRNGLR
ncbi:hypothetical protein CT676_42995, partial [Bradyrhizobium sp. MOS001]